MSSRRNSRTNSQAACRSERHKSYWRLLWVAVLVLHAPITVNAFSAVWADGSGRVSWSSVSLLAFSNLFFVCEIAFAYSLRLLSDRRALLAFILIVALLHVGVIERGFPNLLAPADLNRWLVAGALLVASTTACLLVLRPVRFLRDPARAERTRQLARLLYTLDALPRLRPRLSPADLSCAPSRAPPSFTL